MPEHFKKASLFVGLTYLVSLLVVSLYSGLGGTWTNPSILFLALGYMFIPMTVALIVQKATYKAPLREPLRIAFRPNRWFVVAWLLPLLIAVATFGVGLLLPGVCFSADMEGMFERFGHLLPPDQLQQLKEQASTLPVHPFWLSLLSGMVAGITVNAVAAFGEEVGWRGLLLRELEPLGLWKSSTVIGVVWGFWHAPLILHGHNYPEHPVVGVFLMTVMTVLASPPLGYITLRANSVLAAAVFHGTFNGTAGLAVLLLKGGNDLLLGVTGLAGLIVLAALNVGLFVFGTRNADRTEVEGHKVN
jgi:membrane protease YdiL (CAAX protease family)